MSKKKTHNLLQAATNLASTEKDAQKIISAMPAEMQQKAVDSIDPTINAIAGDAIEIGRKLEKKLGRKPTEMEFIKAAFPSMFGKAVANKDVVKAASGLPPVEDKKKLTDGN